MKRSPIAFQSQAWRRGCRDSSCSGCEVNENKIVSTSTQPIMLWGLRRESWRRGPSRNCSGWASPWLTGDNRDNEPKINDLNQFQIYRNLLRATPRHASGWFVDHHPRARHRTRNARLLSPSSMMLPFVSVFPRSLVVLQSPLPRRKSLVATAHPPSSLTPRPSCRLLSRASCMLAFVTHHLRRRSRHRPRYPRGPIPSPPARCPADRLPCWARAPMYRVRHGQLRSSLAPSVMNRRISETPIYVGLQLRQRHKPLLDQFDSDFRVSRAHLADSV